MKKTTIVGIVGTAVLAIGGAIALALTQRKKDEPEVEETLENELDEEVEEDAE